MVRAATIGAHDVQLKLRVDGFACLPTVSSHSLSTHARRQRTCGFDVLKDRLRLSPRHAILQVIIIKQPDLLPFGNLNPSLPVPDVIQRPQAHHVPLVRRAGADAVDAREELADFVFGGREG